MINDVTRLVGIWITATAATVFGLFAIVIIYELKKELNHGNRTETRT